VAALLALVPAMCFALAAALQQRGQFALAHAGSAVQGPAGPAVAALLAALGGAVLITLANRETTLPGEPTGRSGALTDETLR
jgi:hypothetical protein